MNYVLPLINIILCIWRSRNGPVCPIVPQVMLEFHALILLGRNDVPGSVCWSFVYYWIVRLKEGKYALKWTRLSCHDFVDNQVRLQLFSLAYNLGNFLRRLVLPKKIKNWSFRTLQVKLIKIGAKVVRHSRYVIFQMAEVAVPMALFCEILERIHRLKPVPIGYD